MEGFLCWYSYLSVICTSVYITESNIVPPTTLSFLVGFVYQKKYRHENKVYFTDELRTCNLLSTIKYLQKIQETHDIASCVILKQAWHLQQQKTGSFRLEKVRNVWRMTRKAPKEKHVERSYQKIWKKTHWTLIELQAAVVFGYIFLTYSYLTWFVLRQKRTQCCLCTAFRDCVKRVCVEFSEIQQNRSLSCVYSVQRSDASPRGVW